MFVCLALTSTIPRFSTSLSQHLFMVGSISLCLALLQVLGVIFTSCMFSRLHKMDKYRPVNNARKSY